MHPALAPIDQRNDPPIGDHTNALNDQIVDLCLRRDQAERAHHKERTGLHKTFIFIGLLMLTAHTRETGTLSKPGFLGVLGGAVIGGSVFQIFLDRRARRRGTAHPGFEALQLDEQIHDLTAHHWNFQDVCLWKYDETSQKAHRRQRTETPVLS